MEEGGKKGGIGLTGGRSRVKRKDGRGGLGSRKQGGKVGEQGGKEGSRAGWEGGGKLRGRKRVERKDGGYLGGRSRMERKDGGG